MRVKDFIDNYSFEVLDSLTHPDIIYAYTRSMLGHLVKYDCQSNISKGIIDERGFKANRFAYIKMRYFRSEEEFFTRDQMMYVYGACVNIFSLYSSMFLLKNKILNCQLSSREQISICVRMMPYTFWYEIKDIIISVDGYQEKLSTCGQSTVKISRLVYEDIIPHGREKLVVYKQYQKFFEKYVIKTQI